MGSRMSFAIGLKRSSSPSSPSATPPAFVGLAASRKTCYAARTCRINGVSRAVRSLGRAADGAKRGMVLGARPGRPTAAEGISAGRRDVLRVVCERMAKVRLRCMARRERGQRLRAWRCAVVLAHGITAEQSHGVLSPAGACARLRRCFATFPSSFALRRISLWCGCFNGS